MVVVGVGVDAAKSGRCLISASLQSESGPTSFCGLTAEMIWIMEEGKGHEELCGFVAT